MSNARVPWFELVHDELIDHARIAIETPAERPPFTRPDLARGEVHEPDDIQPASAAAKARCVDFLELKKAQRLEQLAQIRKQSNEGTKS